MMSGIDKLNNEIKPFRLLDLDINTQNPNAIQISENE